MMRPPRDLHMRPHVVVVDIYLIIYHTLNQTSVVDIYLTELRFLLSVK